MPALLHNHSDALLALLKPLLEYQSRPGNTIPYAISHLGVNYPVIVPAGENATRAADGMMFFATRAGSKLTLQLGDRYSEHGDYGRGVRAPDERLPSPRPIC